jgi:hypothetical protein
MKIEAQGFLNVGKSSTPMPQIHEWREASFENSPNSPIRIPSSR